MGKISSYDPDTVLDDADYVVGVDAASGKNKRFLGSVIRAGMATLAGLTDAKARINHTGTQLHSTISDFSSAVLALLPAGAGASISSITSVTQTAHGFSVGQWIALSVSGNYVLGIATSGGAHEAVGVVQTVTDANNFIYQALGNFPQSGLIPGVSYFLSPTTAGAFTPLEPNGAGVVAKPLFTASDENTAALNITASYSNSAGAVASPGSAATLMGINVMNDQTGAADAYKTAENAADLAILNEHLNAKRVRIALPSYNSTIGVANARALALAYKAAGYFVSYGVTGNGATQNSTTYAAWKTQVPTEAAWASAHSINRFYIGNEEDWQAQISNFGTVTDATVRTDVLSLATTLKAAYPSMEIVYSSAQGTVSQWHTAGTGSLDKLGFNMYDTQANFSPNIIYFKSQIGAKYFVSEWGAEHGYKEMVTTGGGTGIYTDAQYATDLASRYATLITQGVEAYFFALRYGDNTRTSGNWNILDNVNKFVPGSREAFGFGGIPLVASAGSFVAKTGDTMSGELNMWNGSATTKMHFSQSGSHSLRLARNVNDASTVDDTNVSAWRMTWSESDDNIRIDYSPPGGWSPSTIFSISNGGRIAPRVLAIGTGATPTFNTDNYDGINITGLATAITSMTSGMTGTPVDGQHLSVAVTGTASRAITWGTGFEASTVALPTTTSSTARLDVEFVWNTATSKWRCVRVA